MIFVKFSKFFKIFILCFMVFNVSLKDFLTLSVVAEVSAAEPNNADEVLRLKKIELLKKKRRLQILKKRREALKAKSALNKTKKEEETKDVPHQFSFHDLNPILRYTFTSDLNEQTDALDGSNSLSLAFSYAAKKRLSLFSGLSLSYETLGSSVFRPSNNEDFFKLSDIYFGAGYQANLKRPLALNYGGSIGFPTSDRSRFEGYKAILSVNGSLLHFLPKVKNLSVGVTGTFDYIFNTFDFSPVSAQAQLLGRAGFSGTLVYKLPYGFRYIGAFWSSLSLFADDSDLSRLGNTHTLFWTKDNISAYMRYSNSDLPERGATDFWFIDEYRKIFSLGLVIRAKKPEVFGKKKGSRPFVNTSVFEEE